MAQFKAHVRTGVNCALNLSFRGTVTSSFSLQFKTAVRPNLKTGIKTILDPAVKTRFRRRFTIPLNSVVTP